MYRADRIISVVIFGAAVVLFVNASGLNALEQTHHGRLGSGFWPMVLLGLIALGSLGLTVRTWRLSPKALALPKPGRPALVLSLLAATFLYALCIQALGFLLATPLFLLILIYTLGMRQVSVLVCVPLGLTGALGVIFLKLFALPIPIGYGIFRTIHLWVL